MEHKDGITGPNTTHAVQHYTLAAIADYNERIEAAEHEIESLRTKRDQAIIALRNSGLSVAELATYAGISRQRIHRILNNS